MVDDDYQLSMPCSFTGINSGNTVINATESTALFTATMWRGIENERLDPNWSSMEQRQELQLMPSKQQGTSETSEFPQPYSKPADEKSSPRLQLSIGLGSEITEKKLEENEIRINEEIEQQKQLAMRLACDEMAYAEHVRRVAKRQLELADIELERAKKIREQAHAELDKARFLKEKATREISEAAITPLEITCRSCQRQFQWPLQYQSPSLNGFLSSINSNKGGADDENCHGNVFPEVSMMRYMQFSNSAVIEIDKGSQDKMQMSLSKPNGQLYGAHVSRTVSSSVTSSTKIEPCN